MEKAPIIQNRVLAKVAGLGMASLAVVGAINYIESSHPKVSIGNVAPSDILPNNSQNRILSPALKPCLTPEKNLKVIQVSTKAEAPTSKQNINSYALYPTGQITPTTSVPSSKVKPSKENLASYTYYPTGAVVNSTSRHSNISTSNREKCVTPIVPGINIELIKKADVFTVEQINQLVANESIYMAVAKKYSLPWQLLATIHWRETNFSMENPGNNNGLFQVYDSYFKPGRLSQSDFISQVDLAARLLATNYTKKAHIAGKIFDGTSVNMMDVGNLLMAYNGQSSFYYKQAYDMGYRNTKLGFLGSPYVSNLINRSFNSRFNRNWEQIRYDNGYALPADQRPGSLPVFVLLMQATQTNIKLDFAGFKKTLAEDITKRF